MRAGIKIAIVLALAGLVAAISPVFASGNSHAAQVTMAGYTGKVQNRVLSDTASGGQSSFIVELAQQADLSRGVRDEGSERPRLVRLPDAQADRRADAGAAQGDARPPGRLVPLVLGRERDHRSLRRAPAREQPCRTGRRQVDRGERRVELADARPTATSSANSLATLQARRSRTTIEPNITLVHAPDLWNLGYTGTGIVVANQDTGMRWTHNALKPHYRGWNGSSADHNYNWHDSIHADINGNGANPCGFSSMVPCDDHGHGTHTTGTAVGDDGAGNQIGVAPGAKWIGCHNMDQGVRQARDVHGVLPVLHRSDRSQRPEPEPGASAARDEQQLGLPGERALRARQPADDRREHAGRGHLRRGLGR